MELKYSSQWTPQQIHAWGRPIAGLFCVGATISIFTFLSSGEPLNALSSFFFALTAIACIFGITAHKKGNKQGMQAFIIFGVIALVAALVSYLVHLLLRTDEQVARDTSEGISPNVVLGVSIIAGVLAISIGIYIAVLVRRRRRAKKRRMNRQRLQQSPSHMYQAGTAPGSQYVSNQDYYQGPFIS